MSDFDESYRLIYADEPGHIRLAGDPWAGIAKVVEQAMAVLEDGQRKLTEVWRSPGGAAYLAEMSRVVEAMRATSDAARHNDQVMSAAADALDGKQKDFAILSTAPIPADARERYARAIVNSLDEDYRQAIANFHPVPAIYPSIDQERPLVADGQGDPSSRSGGTDSTVTNSSASSGSTSRLLPSWVPTPPDEQASRASSHGGTGGAGSAASAGGGPLLQGAGSTSPAPPRSDGSWSGVDGPTTGTTLPRQGGLPGGDAWSGQPSAWNGSSTGRVTKPTTRWRDVAGRSSRGLAQPPRGRPGLVAPEPAGLPNTTTNGRSAAAEQPGSAVGGVPVTGSNGSPERSWSGYRRRPEPFPTSPRAAVPPLIEPAMSDEEAELDEVTTDYIDHCGNQITIRRPRD